MWAVMLGQNRANWHGFYSYTHVGGDAGSPNGGIYDIPFVTPMWAVMLAY